VNAPVAAPARTMVLRSLWALLLCAGLVTVCYFFVDRPVAWFVHEHVPHGWLLKWVTLFPPILVRLAPLVLVVAAVWQAWRPGNRGVAQLLALTLSLIAAVALKDQLKWVFGRYWPETWTMNNPSLIQDGAYGFHPFHRGIAYESFPSGHTTIVFSLTAVVWIVYPRWRWLCVVADLAIVIGLLGMNYHFTSDVIAGAFLGSIVGVFAARLRGGSQGA
jgi:membrane-associated phospholipid phosphatase